MLASVTVARWILAEQMERRVMLELNLFFNFGKETQEMLQTKSMRSGGNKMLPM
jgi:hypothetical protein